MEQNREPRTKPMHIRSINFQQRSQHSKMGKGQYLQEMVLAERDSHMQKDETGLLFYTIHKNQLTID